MSTFMPVPDVPASPAPEFLSEPMRAFLTVLESMRGSVARRLVQDCPAITEPELNSAILRTILRVLFLQAGQQQGCFGPGTLARLAEGDGIDRSLTRACTDAGLDPDILFDMRDSGLRSLPIIPDEVLRDVIRVAGFSGTAVPAGTLTPSERAIAFDHYLGTTMRIAEGYRVKQEGKSAVKYTGSIHPVPQPVVDAMVRATLRGLLERTDPRDRTTLYILDPACGAGIFPLAVFLYLARNKTGQNDIHHDASAAYREILCGSVYGTDIDPESVAVARFILLSAYIEEIRRIGSGAASPVEIRQVAACLAGTIRCGNALLAPDYFSGRQEYPFNINEHRKVNPFDWREAFPEILASGGFDGVIGAPPPYRPFAVPARDEYFQMHYDAYAKGAGLYGFFIEKGIHLLRPGGALAFWIPDTFLSARNARPLRRLLLLHQILEIADTGTSRFLQGGAARMLMLRIVRSPVHQPFTVSRVDAGPAKSPDGSPVMRRFMLDQRTLDDGGWTLEDRRARDIIEKIRERGTPLNDYVMGQIERGTITTRSNLFVIDEAKRAGFLRQDRHCGNIFRPVLRSADIRRYHPHKPDLFLIAAKSARELNWCRAVWKYLQSVAPPVQKESGKGAVMVPSEKGNGSGKLPVPVEELPKILFTPVQLLPEFSYDAGGLYVVSTLLFFIPQKDPFLVAILNSALGRFFIANTCARTEKGYHITPARLGRFPVYTPDFDNLEDKTRHDKMAALVTQMLSLHEYLQRAKTDQEKRLVQQEIDATDVRIDALVYDLYGLTEEGITVVESALPTVKSPS